LYQTKTETMKKINTIKLANDIITMIKKDKFKFNFVPKNWDDVVDTCSHVYYLETAVRKQSTSCQDIINSGLYPKVKSLVNEWLVDSYKARKKDYFWNKPQNNPNPLEAIMGEL